MRRVGLIAQTEEPNIIYPELGIGLFIKPTPYLESEYDINIWDDDSGAKQLLLTAYQYSCDLADEHEESACQLTTDYDDCQSIAFRYDDPSIGDVLDYICLGLGAPDLVGIDEWNSSTALLGSRTPKILADWLKALPAYEVIHPKS